MIIGWARTIISGVIAMLCCVACTSTVAPMETQTTHTSQKVLQQAQQNAQNRIKPAPKILPAQVMSDLTPMPKNKASSLQAHTFDIVVKAIPADQFFLNLMQNSGENILVAPGVTGEISLNLHHVTVQEVLQAIKVLYGFNYHTTHFGYQIDPRRIDTRIFYLSHPNVIQTSNSNVSVAGIDLSAASGATGAQGNGSNTSLATNFSAETFWPEILATLTNMVKNDVGSYVNTNANTGVVVVAAYPDTLEKVAGYLQAVQEINNRQVIIDAKIIELTLSKQFKTGIDWAQAGLSVSSSTGVFHVTNPLSLSDIDSVVTLLSQQGIVNVLSNPRISVTNNRPALIKVGNDSYYVTAVNSGTTPVGTTATLSSNLNLTPFFSGVSLDVIPTIMPNGTIKLHIHPMVSKVTEQDQSIQLSSTQQLNLPLASSDIREVDSNVEMESGQIIVLGGLMQHADQLSATSFAGSKFSAAHPFHNDEGAVTELVILLKATLTNKDAWLQEIKATSERYDSLGTQGGEGT